MGSNAKNMAVGSIFAALAVVLMSIGTLIPLATFVCPMLCMVVLSLVFRLTNARMAWAWYICVAVMSLLFAPDKEAAACFVFLGYYPIVKPRIDGWKFPVFWKLLLFNAGILGMYVTLIYVLGMDALLQEFAEMGSVLGLVTAGLGNFCLFCVDFLLNRMEKFR